MRDYRRRKKETGSCSWKQAVCWRLAAALFILSAGYILFEYRLFGEMLFSPVVTMRSTMAEDNFTAGQIASTIWDVFYQAIFHAQPSHTRFVLPLCLLFLAFRIICFLREKSRARS